jgi:chemosensory pili system protein ChpA (sensor histidine kinase/response regulator)
MERMVAPLEHMLRNAVDHGIENAERREQAGKSKAGRITLSLSREGSNVLLLLTDDGAGMSVERIREKAIQQELMNPDAQLSEQEILQFIFQAGFSTAESVTQISGRGVGMDVVSSEIKQLGGSVDISSVEGEGTQFHIRLPFTVSVNRALMISMGDDRYAVPLNSIEGIARIAPDQLAGYYSDPDSRFHYAGTDYQLQYMGSLLNAGVEPKIEGHQLPVPVLLVRNVDHSVAIQVDSLNGSQEIVVKALGAQFSTVQGLSGATIMGDGNVVVILDTNAIIRQQYALATTLKLPEPDEHEVSTIVNRNPVVMVVDDSVTVRKVTTRFLEREGFDVITAKDGVDAIEVLRDQLPDLMLLDIEMPRMDGFEVARRVRATSMTKHLPIIMITSRTGEKHRETGLAAGANEYMGKPFQEDILLENIQHLLHIKH